MHDEEEDECPNLSRSEDHAYVVVERVARER